MKGVSKMKRKIYLAYGSNMSLLQMYHRCPDAAPIGRGLIKDYRLMFKGSKSGNYATIEYEKGQMVPVVAWAISARDEKYLDRYEGFPSFYIKDTLEFEIINNGSGKRKKALGLVYVMPPENSELGLPSDGYMDVLLEGYHRFGFQEKILWDAYDYSDVNG